LKFSIFNFQFSIFRLRCVFEGAIAPLLPPLITVAPSLLLAQQAQPMVSAPGGNGLFARFDLRHSCAGWQAGFADYPAGQESFYQLAWECAGQSTDLPQGLFISGNNHSDDLFMFIKHRIAGFKPLTTYQVEASVEFLSKAPTGCLGAGGDPGADVYMKFGASAEEPAPVVQPDGMARMNVDIGHQSHAGSNAVVIGNIATSITDCHNERYELKELATPRPLSVRSDRSGALWIFVGTDSGFEGRTSLIYTQVRVRFHHAEAPPASPRLRAERILVKPKAGVALTTLAAFHTTMGTQVLRTFPGIGTLQILQLPPGANVADVISAYQRSGLVAYAEPDHPVQSLATPNDPGYLDGSLWALTNYGQLGGTPGADIKAPAGWDLQNTASDIIVAVIDTGARLTHEDLAANLWVNPGESGFDQLGLPRCCNGRDDDGDGYLDDVHGIDAILGTGFPNDDDGHGTHVSGIIGAVGNNSVGVVGVAWRVQLMECRFIDTYLYPTAPGYISDAITCINYAISKGANIINASWGGYNFNSQALYDAINSARNANMIFVAACGNSAGDNDSNPLYPASYTLDNIIAVAATTRTDALASWSNFGATTVHLGAPGLDILSCWDTADNAYQGDSGTSMAAAHVSGVCALVWAHFPTETYRQIINRVLAGTDPLPSLAGKCVTGGRLNLQKALSSTSSPQRPRLAVTSSATAPFQLQLFGTPNQTYVIQAATNLANWINLSTNRTDSTGLTTVVDPQSTRLNRRFYRATLATN
jgi:subtilisin family serine protease